MLGNGGNNFLFNVVADRAGTLLFAVVSAVVFFDRYPFAVAMRARCAICRNLVGLLISADRAYALFQARIYAVAF